MESIVIQELLILSWEESALWELHWAVNAMFPEENESKNLDRAIEVASWLRDTKRIDFLSENSEKERSIKENKEMLLKHDTWKLDEWKDAILVVRTDLGDAFSVDSGNKFLKSLSTDGFSRNGKQYTLSPKALAALKRHEFRHVIRTLGMPPVTLKPGFLKHTDSWSKTQCIVHATTNTIADILPIDEST